MMLSLDTIKYSKLLKQKKLIKTQKKIQSMTELFLNQMLGKYQSITHGSSNISWLTLPGKGQFYFEVLLKFNLDFGFEHVCTWSNNFTHQ